MPANIPGMKPHLAAPTGAPRELAAALGRTAGRTRGFTLVEVAFASFVMAMAIATSLTALQYSYRAIDSARYTTLAGQILQSQMEKLRLLTWAQLTDPVNGPIAKLYGTRTAAQAGTSGDQNISIAGNGVLSGVVYAPNANISMNGGGNNGIVLGSMIGDTIGVTGNSTFHYDESLANLSSSNIWGVTKWRELSSASDRTTYTDQLNF